MRLSMRHPSVDLVGQTSIGQLAALLQQSHLYVGNDSAPLHLAAAVGTPVVGIFGPTDPAINGPYNAAGAGLVHEDACSQRRTFVPGPLTACPNCRCVELVSVERAWEATASLLAATAQNQSR
jgi:ADP-heptose:LPS heptosyltransferase